jgi:hypothetical protein
MGSISISPSLVLVFMSLTQIEYSGLVEVFRGTRVFEEVSSWYSLFIDELVLPGASSTTRVDVPLVLTSSVTKRNRRTCNLGLQVWNILCGFLGRDFVENEIFTEKFRNVLLLLFSMSTW